jgi:hypothetical protein
MIVNGDIATTNASGMSLAEHRRPTTRDGQRF